jgi:hypothetical protein
MKDAADAPARDLLAYPEVDRIIADLREEVARGESHWFFALLAAIRRWPLPCETVGGRTFRYLVGGEAFDWLLLAERLTQELDGLLPEHEVEDLLFYGRFPVDLREDEFQRLLGAKYRAHLNFVYGVRVEQALQYAVQAEVQKERFSHVWERSAVEDEAFARLYGYTLEQLAEAFRRDQKLPAGDSLSLAELTEFTYWLFKYRMRMMEPARVASDTRKGLAQLRLLESLRTDSSATLPDDEP